jgi:HK97 family phage portal protein
MSKDTKAGGWSIKQIFYSLRDAVSLRHFYRDPNNRDITREPIGGGSARGDASPRIDRALQLSTVWSCVRLISGTISTLPLFMYERAEKNGRTVRVVAREHPLFTLLHDSPNADMTPVEFWEAIAVGLLTWGNAYVLKTRSGGRLVALDPLNPAEVTVVRSLDGDVRYVHADARGRREYTEAEVWHIKGFGSDGLIGLSPIGMGWRSMLGAANVEQAASRVFGGNMRPSGVVTIEEILNTDQRGMMKEVIEKGVFGNDQMGYVHLLEGGAKFQQLTINPVDAQMAETLARSVEDICRWFQVPPSMIGHGTAVSNWGTGREQINLGFKQYVLEQYTKRIEKSINKHLLTPAERKRYYAEYSFEGMLRADSAGRSAFYSTALQNGWMTRNEVRELENWEAVDGADDLTCQSNLVPVKLLGKSPAASTPPEPEETENDDPDQVD